IGAVTQLGNDARTTWECMKAGRSGIRRITLFDPSRVDAKIGGEVRDFDAEAVMPRKEIRRNDRYVHYAWAATAEALADAGIANPIEDEELAERTGALIGSGIGGINTMVRDIIEAHELGVERVGPFPVTAKIFVMGDGSGVLVLEALEHAQARGARIRAELVGYAATDDASHITLPAPGGRGAAKSMELALADADLGTDDVDYINAHGTSTPPND